MAFDDMIEKIGMTIDAAGVVVIVVGAAIAFVASAARVEITGRWPWQKRETTAFG